MNDKKKIRFKVVSISVLEPFSSAYTFFVVEPNSFSVENYRVWRLIQVFILNIITASESGSKMVPHSVILPLFLLKNAHFVFENKIIILLKVYIFTHGMEYFR